MTVPSPRRPNDTYSKQKGSKCFKDWNKLVEMPVNKIYSSNIEIGSQMIYKEGGKKKKG